MTSRWSPAGKTCTTEHSSAARPASTISAPESGPRRCGTSSSISRAPGRFAAAGRPGARLMLDDVPHRRGPDSGALIVEAGLAALECSVVHVFPAGDHLLVIARVTGVPYVGDSEAPLVRFRRRYQDLR